MQGRSQAGKQAGKQPSRQEGVELSWLLSALCLSTCYPISVLHLHLHLHLLPRVLYCLASQPAYYVSAQAVSNLKANPRTCN